jgi:FRG domain
VIQEIICKSWLDIQKHLYADSWNEELERHRSRFAFRGMVDQALPLQTTLQRMGGPYEHLESHLLRAFRKYAHPHVATTEPGMVLSPHGNSLWNWLVLARHHGLPTRLLDWTYSPYVALHFATIDLHTSSQQVDSAIWCVDYQQTHKLLPDMLTSTLDMEVSDVFTVEMLAQLVPDLSALEQVDGEDGSPPFPLFFEPPSLDARIVNQFSLFSMMSSATARLDEWLDAHPQLCQRIILPASIKWEIRDKLDQANITERLLSPGLDGLCQWLRRYYGARPSTD